MRIKKLLLSASVGLMLGSCSTPQLGYFHGVQSGQTYDVSAPKFVTLQPGDKLSILVSSKDPNLAYLFNLPIVGHYRTSSSEQSLNSTQVASYTVDKDGSIDFPVLGEMRVAGLSRKEVSSLIKSELIRKELLKDPIVIVDFLDLTYGVMGEVKNPGRYGFDHDKLTILDALSRAGDLTIYGLRDNVLVAREDNGKQTYYRVNLTNADELYTSPVFYLKPNDLIYVEPNTKRVKESTEVGNAFSQPTLWLSVASLLTSVSVLVFK